MVTLMTFPFSKFASALISLPFQILIKLITKFAYFPLLIFYVLENGEKVDQFRYFHDIINWIHKCHDGNDYNTRLIIANEFISKTYSDMNKNTDVKDSIIFG
eukprot:329100_1